MLETNLKRQQLEWLHFNRLPSFLYEDFVEDLCDGLKPSLERSIKLSIETGNILNQQRYSINTINSTEEFALRSIQRFQTYTKLPKDALEANVHSWFFPNFKHDWYIGIDNNTYKLGVDYHGKYITGIAYKDLQLYQRSYHIYEHPDWHSVLRDHISLYDYTFNLQIKRALNYTIEKTLNLEDSYIYIKQDVSGIVWHFNCKTFEYPQFSCLLNSSFNEKFAWFSLDSNLKYITLYIIPDFS
jgi:hypothetical protein